MHDPATPSPLSAYGQWIATAPADWPLAARAAARDAFLDLVGVAIRGAAEPQVRAVAAAARDWGQGPCVAIGQAARLSPPFAALVNGAAAHVLDFDDNFNPAKTHASAVLVPAILAMADRHGASGAALIDAYLVGLQILGRIGEGLNPVHRQLGWHATATVGAIGAAAACARLAGLDATRAAWALSIAISMAGGSVAQFGTAMKATHAGLAAQAGVMAAGLAAAGVDAGLAALDGPAGMTRLMVGRDYEAIQAEWAAKPGAQPLAFRTEKIGEPLFILSEGLRAKRFPNCAGAHRAMDCLLAIREAQDFAPEDVAAITVHAPRLSLNNLMFSAPETPLQAKFSLQFALALLLVDGTMALSHFTAETVARADLRALYGRIAGVPFDAPEGTVETRVEVRLHDGRRFEASRMMAVGSKAAPFTLAQYVEKFTLCAAGLLAPDALAEVREMLVGLDSLPDARALTARLI